MNLPDHYTVRPMRRDELDIALDLAAAEGWNPGLSDAEAFWAADRHGFFVGDLDGELVGCISGVAYGAQFGFVGLYIVRPEYRGRGYGLPLWQAAMDHLSGRNIGLDGVVEQQENYKKSGFTWAFRSIRFKGVASGVRSESAVDATQVDRKLLRVYDRLCFPAEREQFLDQWLHAPGIRALAWLEDGHLAGYGVIRPCREGFKIGPLFADNPSAAEGLLDALCSSVVGQPVFLDVAEPHAQAVALAEGRGMTRVFETARMYTRGEPNIDATRVWGVTTFELG